MAKAFAAIVVAIVLMTAGALVLVHRFTEPLPPGAGSAAAAPGWPAADPSAQGGSPGAAPYQDGSDAGSPAGFPPGQATSGPRQNESPPIPGAPPVALPEDPEERSESLQAIRQQRRNEQIERLNRRNQQRLGAGGRTPKHSPADADQ